MKIAILREPASENRVAATPETSRKFIALGLKVSVESGLGVASSFADEDYAEAGADVAGREAVLADADVVLAVTAPAPELLSGIKPGALLIGLLDPYRQGERIAKYACLGLQTMAMEFLPRITRAQSMDVLSSQSNLAGYRAVVEASHAFGRAFPMMMTAAGTITAARVFVLGVGVAGLQAIATAKRLGAQVSATDVRSAVKEQIESLGAKAIFVQQVASSDGEVSGGYASEMSEEYRKAQAELVSAHIAKQDIVITTALIPGRPAPRLITDAQVASMKRGSVIVDLAIEQGGNVEGSVAGQIVERHGVKIVALGNLPALLAGDASSLYARNLFNFLTAFWDRQAGGLRLPDNDEIIDGVRLTRAGRIVHRRLVAQPA